MNRKLIEVDHTRPAATRAPQQRRTASHLSAKDRARVLTPDAPGRRARRGNNFLGLNKTGK